MKKKLILMLALAAIAVCLLAISANAGQISGYQQFEVELLDGSVITVYESANWDQWQGRLNFTDNTYTEPPLDTEKTYPLLDWSQVVVADFTNGHRKQLNTNTGEYEVKYGTNNGFSMHLNSKNFTKANATSLKTIKTGNATVVLGGILQNLPALEEVICGERLKEIGWNAFENNKKLTNIDFSACENFTTFGWQVFKGCTALETVVLPNTLTNINSHVFSGCTSLKSVVLSTALTAVDASTFSGCTSLETVSFVGTPSEALKNAAAAAAPNAEITSLTPCEAYGHSNMTSVNGCIEQCGACGAIVEKDIQNHNKASKIEYKDGYAVEGEITYSCTNEGCKYSDKGQAKPLFETIGYSAPEDIDRGGIVIGYVINYDAIAEYEKATGKAVSFGVYAIAQEKLGENDIFDGNGNLAEGAISAEVEKNAYVSFEFKIVGFNDDTKEKLLAIGAYVALTKDKVTEYSYMQLGTPDEGAKYAFTSYTEYLNSIS